MALDLYVYTGANSIRSSLVRDETDVTALARAPEFSLGDRVPVNLYLVDADDTFSALSGSGSYTPTLALAPESPVPTGGTWLIGVGTDMTSGVLVTGKRYRIRSYLGSDSFTNVGAATNTTGTIFVATGTTPTTWTSSSVLEEVTTDIDFDATASEVEAALNATAILAALGGVDVVAGETAAFEVTFRNPGARNALRPLARDLQPASAVGVAEIVAGGVSTQEVQSLRLQTKTAALCDSWTPIADGWTGTLDLATVELLLLLGKQASAQALLELEVAGPSSFRQTYLQTPVRCYRDRVDAGTLGEAPTSGVYTEAEVDALLAGLIARGDSTNNSGNSTVTLPAGCRYLTTTLAFTGAASTRIVVLTASSMSEGRRIDLLLSLPATAGIVVEVRNGTTGGTLLATLTTDASGDDASLRFLDNGAAWVLDQARYPNL